MNNTNPKTALRTHDRWVFIVAAIGIALSILLQSCNPKSAMMTKAVVLDSIPRVTDAQSKYKLNILSYGVVEYHIMYGLYEVGDTILIHDKWRNYEIR